MRYIYQDFLISRWSTYVTRSRAFFSVEIYWGAKSGKSPPRIVQIFRRGGGEHSQIPSSYYLPVITCRQALAQTWNTAPASCRCLTGTSGQRRYRRRRMRASIQSWTSAGSSIPGRRKRACEPRRCLSSLGLLPGTWRRRWSRSTSEIFLWSRMGLLNYFHPNGNSRWSTTGMLILQLINHAWRAGRGDPGREERRSRVLQAPARSQEGVRAAAGRHQGFVFSRRRNFLFC